MLVIPLTLFQQFNIQIKMALTPQIKQQLEQYLALMESPVTIQCNASNNREMEDLLTELISISNQISLVNAELPRAPSFQVGNRITFAGIPMGHEFTS
jgi:alkyl hydroperoxide reductase subunit F